MSVPPFYNNCFNQQQNKLITCKKLGQVTVLELKSFDCKFKSFENDQFDSKVSINDIISDKLEKCYYEIAVKKTMFEKVLAMFGIKLKQTPSSEDEWQNKYNIKDIILSITTAHLCSLIIAHPLDQLKIRSQTQGNSIIERVKSNPSCLQNGFRLSLIKNLALNVQFQTQQFSLQKVFKNNFENVSNFQSQLAGAMISQFIASLLTAPFDSMKIKQIANKNSDFLNTFRFSKLNFRITQQIILYDLIFSSFQCPFVAELRIKMKENKFTKNLSEKEFQFVSTSIGGILSSILSHPIDTLKTQTITHKIDKSIPNILQEFVDKQGYKKLMKGQFYKSASVIPNFVITLCIQNLMLEISRKYIVIKNLN